MTAALVVAWPIDNPEARMWQLEREARAEWSGHVAAAGIWATTDPVFTIEETTGGELELIGRADAIIGPLEPRTLRRTP